MSVIVIEPSRRDDGLSFEIPRLAARADSVAPGVSVVSDAEVGSDVSAAAVVVVVAVDVSGAEVVSVPALVVTGPASESGSPSPLQAAARSARTKTMSRTLRIAGLYVVDWEASTVVTVPRYRVQRA